MGVDVADLFRHYLAIGQRQLHTGRTACTARGRGSKVVSIAVGTVAYDLGINFGTAYPGSLQLFQQQYAAALAHHKAAAAGIKRNRGPGRVVRRAKGFHAGKAAHAQRADAAFAAAAEHTVLVPIADTVERIADRIGTACTGGGGAAAHALQAKTDGNLPRRHIANGHGDKIRTDFFKATLLAAGVFFLDRGQAADAAGKDNTEPCAVDFFQCKTAVTNRFLSGGHGKLGKARHFAGFTFVDTFGGVKILDLCGQLYLKIGRIKSGDRPNGAAASLNSGPAFSHGIAGRIYRAKAGDNDPAFLFCVHCTPHIPIPPSTQRTWPVM